MSTSTSTSTSETSDVPTFNTTDANLEAMFDSLLQTSAGSGVMPPMPVLHRSSTHAARKAPVGDRGTPGAVSEPTPANANVDASTVQDITDALQTDAFPVEIEQSIADLVHSTAGQQPELQVTFANDAVQSLYANVDGELETTQYATDSGWDLRFPEDLTVNPGETVKCDFGVSVCAHDEEGEPCAVLMLPRSSIVKTPLRMANSVGLIDSSYRGTLRVYMDNVKTEAYHIKRGDRLFQLMAPSARPLVVRVKTALPVSERGDKGFGSTGV